MKISLNRNFVPIIGGSIAAGIWFNSVAAGIAAASFFSILAAIDEAIREGK